MHTIVPVRLHTPQIGYNYRKQAYVAHSSELGNIQIHNNDSEAIMLDELFT